MATITLQGTPIQTSGELPSQGSKAPDFRLTTGDLSDKSLKDFSGKKKIIHIVPSLDTSVCATSARRFNENAGQLDQTVLLNVSADLPFAQQRFCETEGLEHVVTLSTMRAPSFGQDYGVVMTDGPLAGLMSRAIVILDAQDHVVYTEQVPEIVQEPNYDAALEAVKAIS